ncbi:MAG: hypothetical protein EBR82_51375 [Caulobacteraceae bacterium]|nr:hypothetical protein [bacterium]NBW16413.1 hypothetical protein [Caulobacteraceae bacterium]
MSKDYTFNYNDALELAATIEKYWHSRDYTHVRAWPEKRFFSNDPHDKRYHYAIASNIKFNSPRATDLVNMVG